MAVSIAGAAGLEGPVDGQLLESEEVLRRAGHLGGELADLVVERGATVLLVSTHNGMALSYATALLAELEAREVSPQVIFGGQLNQDVEGQEMPVDVSAELTDLGIDVCRDAADLASIIRN